MINGHDVHFAYAAANPDPIEDGTAVVRDFWPDMIYEDDNESPRRVGYEGMRERFIYKNAAAKAAWDSVGWSEDNGPLLIHLLVRPQGTEMTVVHEKCDDIVFALKKKLSA